MLNEAAAIWSPLGVEVEWDRGDRHVQMRVVVTDDAVEDRNERLGWIRFLSGSRPEPIVYVSAASAGQLLDSTASLRNEPPGYRDVLLARILGRALAHEIGHYVLGSEAHTHSGLMRPSWPLDALIAADRRAFSLRPGG
jgi:hypothetical protein